MLTEPCDAVVFDVTVKLVPASLANTDAPFRTTPARVEPVSLAATGVTVMETVALVVCPAASVAVYVKESGPE